MTLPSPTPWEVKQSSKGFVYIADADGKMVVKFPKEENRPGSEDNANFIVGCVNKVGTAAD